jgi:N-acetyl sugar amidotransferase
MTLTRCTRCVMPTTRPDTEFVDRTCTACLAYDARQQIDWSAREQDLRRILESVKPNADGYHCVVPSSGGKDSHWQVLKLIEMGVRPLVVTATTCMLTSVGARNIRNLARYATTVEITPNLRVRSLLNRLGLELVGDISWPEHVSIFSTPWRIAHRMEIPLIFYGENPQNAYGGPIGTLDDALMTESWITQFGGHLRMRAYDLVGEHGLTWEDMADYMLPAPLDMAGLSVRFLGYYFPWNSHENARVSRSAGMFHEPPTQHSWWEHENLDNAQTGLHDFFKYLKFGFGRVCDQVSCDIRYGETTREQAFLLLRNYDGKFPWKYMGVPFEEVLDKLEISIDAFKNIVLQHINRDLFGRIDHDRFEYTLKEFCDGGQISQ